MTSLRTAMRIALRSSLECRQLLDERAGERRVASVAIQRDVAGLRREADQRADAASTAASPCRYPPSACPWRARDCARAGCRGRHRGTGCWCWSGAPSCDARRRAGPSRTRARQLSSVRHRWGRGSFCRPPAIPDPHRRTRRRRAFQRHGEVTNPSSKPALSRSSPSITWKPSLASAAATSAASFLGLASAAVCLIRSCRSPAQRASAPMPHRIPTPCPSEARQRNQRNDQYPRHATPASRNNRRYCSDLPWDEQIVPLRAWLGAVAGSARRSLPWFARPAFGPSSLSRAAPPRSRRRRSSSCPSSHRTRAWLQRRRPPSPRSARAA